MIDGCTSALLASAVTTTTSDVASTVANTDHVRYHSLYVYWTPGSSSSDTLTLKIETNAEEETSTAVWVQDQSGTLSGGHITFAVQDLQFVTSATTQIFRRYDFTVNAKQIRVKYSDSLGGGTLTMKLLSKSL